jgi:hypothetical protein
MSPVSHNLDREHVSLEIWQVKLESGPARQNREMANAVSIYKYLGCASLENKRADLKCQGCRPNVSEE